MIDAWSCQSNEATNEPDIRREVEDLLPIGERTLSSDFGIWTNARSLSEIEILGFFDSRAKKCEPHTNQTIAHLLAERFAQQSPYLIITRSHASTTFFTLCNFLENWKGLHREPFRQLWTNVGFVDLTPKKRDVVDDMILQARAAFPEVVPEFVALESYEISSGDMAVLYTLELGPYLPQIARCMGAAANNVALIATHEVPQEVVFPRARPRSFYSQLKETNSSLRVLSESMGPVTRLIQPPILDGGYLATLFDGVHFTPEAHLRIFGALIDS